MVIKTENLKKNPFDESVKKNPFDVAEQPQSDLIAIRRQQLPRVFDYNKQLDQLLGEGNLDDFLPLDVKYDFGRIIKMTSEPAETEGKIKLSLLYKSLADISPQISFNLMDELNKITFRKYISPSGAWKHYQNDYTKTKTYVEALKHGYRRAGVMMTKQVAGLTKMAGEFFTPQTRVKPFFPALNEFEKKQADKLKGWSDMMLAGVNEYYQTHKEEAIQILPNLGYKDTLLQYVFEPKNLIQGIVESSPLMLEGILGTVFGGTAGGITTMAVPITGEVYAQAREEGTEPLPAFVQSILTGVGEATIEQWTLGRKLGLMKNFKKIVAEGLPKILWEGTKTFFRGTAEEGSQEFNRNFWQWIFTDRSQQWLDNVKESMAAGGPMELVMAGAFSVVGAAGGAVVKEQQVDRIDQIAEAVEAEPILSEEHKAEIRRELDKVRESIEQDEFEVAEESTEAVPAPEKPVEAITPAEAAKQPVAEGGVEKGLTITKEAAIISEKGEQDVSKKPIRERIRATEDLQKKTKGELESLKQLLEDTISTAKAKREQPKQVHLDRLADVNAILEGKKPIEGIASNQVFGHPQATNIPGYEHLIPIKVTNSTNLNGKIERAQSILDKIANKIATNEAIVKKRIKSTPAQMKKAKAYMDSMNRTEDETIRDLLRDETIPELNRLSKAQQLTPPSEGKVVEKRAEKIPKFIKIEKEVIPKVSKEKFTPSEVKEELIAETPESDSETQNAANLLEEYWREFDERELEINVAATKNQEAIAKALNIKRYAPESDIDTSKMSQAMMLYIDLKEHPSGKQFAEELSKLQREIYELSKNLPAQIQKIADSIIEQNRAAGALAIDKEIIAVARENYIAHLWERPTRQESLRARFRQTTARAKARTLEGGIMEGWAKGKKLRVDDVTLATQIAQSQINQAIVGREMLKLGKKWGLLSAKQGKDWVKVEHPGFTTWKWAGKAEKAKTYGRNFFVTEEGDLMERVPVYAELELGKKLNNVFSPSALYKVPGIETISRYNAQIKSTILFTSLYHHQAFLRSYAFGSRGLNPKVAYEKGRQAIMNMTPEVRLLVRNGLTVGRIQDYDPRMIEGKQTIWGRALTHTKPTEAAREKLVALRKRQERFLFNKMGPALKMQAGILELKAELKRNQTELEEGIITPDEIAAAVANLINNDFGGLHLGRMGRSQTAQHIFRLLALAPDWTESNIRSAVDAFRKGETGYLHRMFWGRIAAKGLGATILFNLLLSAFDDDDFAERYRKAWKTGRLRWLDIDITPIFRAMGGGDDKRKYFSLLGHFRDPIKFTAHPIVSAKHKGSVVSRIMMDMMIGEDWAGRKFTTLGELTGITENGKNSGRLVKYGRGGARPIEPSQIPSYALYEVRSAMPIPMQNLIAFLGGELDAFDAITKSAGLMTATTYPERKKRKLVSGR